MLVLLIYSIPLLRSHVYGAKIIKKKSTVLLSSQFPSIFFVKIVKWRRNSKRKVCYVCKLANILTFIDYQFLLCSKIIIIIFYLFTSHFYYSWIWSIDFLTVSGLQTFFSVWFLSDLQKICINIGTLYGFKQKEFIALLHVNIW